MADEEDWRARALKAEATVAQILNATYPADGEDYVHEHGPEDGWVDCPGCWVQTIRQLAGITDPDRLPAYEHPWEHVPPARPVEDHHLPPLPPLAVPLPRPWEPSPELRATFAAAIADHRAGVRPPADVAAIARAAQSAVTVAAYRSDSAWIHEAVRIVADDTLAPDAGAVIGWLGAGRSYVTIDASPRAYTEDEVAASLARTERAQP